MVGIAIVLICLLAVYSDCMKNKEDFSEQSEQRLKVAVLFAGRIRGYETVLGKLHDIKNRYTPTYYCSLNEPTYDEYTDNFCKTFDISRDRINIESTPYPDFIKAAPVRPGFSNMQNWYSMLYHENKAFKMIENDITKNKKHFDCILYYRADIDSPDTLILEYPKSNTLYIPNGHDYLGINDRVAYGDFDSMKKYCSVVDIIQSAESMNGINPEIMIKRHLESHKLEIIRFKFNTCLSKERNEKKGNCD